VFLIPPGPLKPALTGESIVIDSRALTPLPPKYSPLQWTDFEFKFNDVPKDQLYLEPTVPYGKVGPDGELDPSAILIWAENPPSGQESFKLSVEIGHGLADGTIAIFEFGLEIIEDVFKAVEGSIAAYLNAPVNITQVEFYGVNVVREYSRYRTGVTDIGLQVLRSRVTGALRSGVVRSYFMGLVRLEANKLRVEFLLRLFDTVYGYLPVDYIKPEFHQNIVLSAVLRVQDPVREA